MSAKRVRVEDFWPIQAAGGMQGWRTSL